MMVFFGGFFLSPPASHSFLLMDTVCEPSAPLADRRGQTGLLSRAHDRGGPRTVPSLNYGEAEIQLRGRVWDGERLR